MREHGVHHAALLIDLDRVNRGIAALVGIGLHGRAEGPAQLVDAMVQDSRETDQHRQGQALTGKLFAKLVEVHPRVAGTRVGAREHVPGFVDIEIAVAPMGNVVGVARLRNAPVHKLNH